MSAANSARLQATPANVKLCALQDIKPGRARNFVLQLRDGRFHGFVVRQAASVYGYLDQCPHAGMPLAQTLDDYLTPDGGLIACSWHGALFEVATGLCRGGPCVGQKLVGWPVHVEDGWIKTGTELRPVTPTLEVPWK